MRVVLDRARPRAAPPRRAPARPRRTARPSAVTETPAYSSVSAQRGSARSRASDSRRSDKRERQLQRPAPDRGRDRDRVRVAGAGRQAPRRCPQATTEARSSPRARPPSRAAGWPSRAARRWTCRPTAAPISRLTRALIVRCASPVLRAITPTSVARSARSRSRCSNAVSGSTDPTAAAGVVVKAASAGDAAGGAGSAKSCSASPGWVVCSTSSSRRALDDSARKASPVSPRSPRSATCSPTGPRSSAWLRSSSTSIGELLQPRIGRQEDVRSSAPSAPACGG